MGKVDVAQSANTIPAKRQQIITEYLITKRNISIKEAADLCGVSEATARRDLDDLANEGIVERTHGGAVINKGAGFEEIHEEKMKVMMPEKTKIAEAAMKLVKDGSSIFLDSGTTTLMLADCLHKFKNLTVITNNLDIAYKVKLNKTSSLIVTGGIRRDEYSVLVGDITRELIDKIKVDVSFLGADAINPSEGVFNSNFMEVGVKKSIIKCGELKVLLSDHSKFEKRALAKVCDLEEFDVIITDKGIDEETKKIIEEKGIDLIMA